MKKTSFYQKLRLDRWSIPFSVLMLFLITAIGGSIADAIYEADHFIYTNQIWSGLITLGVIFALGYPKQMFVTSKIKWSNMKYTLFPLIFISCLPILQGGYDFTNINSSMVTYMISVGFAEEIFMHSLVMGVMILAWGDNRLSLVKSAFLGSLMFGFVHLLAIMHDPTNASFVLFKITTVGFSFLISFGFAGLVYQTNTIWIAVIFHGLFDVVAGNVGDPVILARLFDNWNWMNSAAIMLYALPFGIFGYWLLVKDFGKESS